VRSNSTR